jgi:Holliday junction resolvase-like predicted endonuclease
MELSKSSRHSKITGDFAEAPVLYWLSKYGFECAKVDHTGIDLIARNPNSNELMGISVKSRSRNTGIVIFEFIHAARRWFS